MKMRVPTNRDKRNGIPQKNPGDKLYNYVEYSPDYFGNGHPSMQTGRLATYCPHVTHGTTKTGLRPDYDPTVTHHPIVTSHLPDYHRLCC